MKRPITMEQVVRAASASTVKRPRPGAEFFRLLARTMVAGDSLGIVIVAERRRRDLAQDCDVRSALRAWVDHPMRTEGELRGLVVELAIRTGEQGRDLAADWLEALGVDPSEVAAEAQD